MAFHCANLKFEGPFQTLSMIQNLPGIYSLVSLSNFSIQIVALGEDAAVQDALAIMLESERWNTINSDYCVAAHYSNKLKSERLLIVDKIVKQVSSSDFKPSIIHSLDISE